MIAANRTVTREMAETSRADLHRGARRARRSSRGASSCSTQKKNLRLLTLPEGFTPTVVELRQVSGGLLLQQADRHFAPASEWTLAAGDPADAATLADLEFAWRAAAR